MKCPHCLTDFHDEPSESIIVRRQGQLQERDGTTWKTRSSLCPACGRAIIVLEATLWVSGPGGSPVPDVREIRVWPKGVARALLPAEVTDPFANDYREACMVLPDSPKASAALSRRCLQQLLREKAGVKPGKLYAEIDEAIQSGKLPPYITESLLDAVRHFGNFAAHPEKDVNTGEVIEVAPGEAEWCLDIVETLFDFYFVQPAKVADKAARLREKLKNAGKQPTA